MVPRPTGHYSLPGRGGKCVVEDAAGWEPSRFDAVAARNGSKEVFHIRVISRLACKKGGNKATSSSALRGPAEWKAGRR